jgi:hypothetical protein
MGSRAVIRRIEPDGIWPKCPHCQIDIKYKARDSEDKRKKVVCNVYEGEKWDRVEQFHLPCYIEAGQPHGQVAS